MVEFSAKHKELLDGLLFTGELTAEFSYAGHTFVVHTLRAEEMYLIGKLIAEYRGTSAENLAYKVAAVALAIDYVDGMPLAESISTEDTYNARAKFKQVSKWFPVVVDKAFAEYIELEAKAKEVADKLGES